LCFESPIPLRIFHNFPMDLAANTDDTNVNTHGERAFEFCGED